MPTREQMHQVILDHLKAEDDADEAAVLATYTADAPVFVDVPTGRRYEGGQQIIGNYSALWQGLPGLKREITRWTFGEDAVVLELTLVGKHTGTFRGVPPSGRDVRLPIVAHFQFGDDGRIKQETAYYDSLTFMRQLCLTRPD